MSTILSLSKDLVTLHQPSISSTKLSRRTILRLFGQFFLTKMSLSKLYVCKRHVLRFVTILANKKIIVIFNLRSNYAQNFLLPFNFVSIFVSFINTSHGTFSIPLFSFSQSIAKITT
jgi:hypothetical protein